MSKKMNKFLDDYNTKNIESNGNLSKMIIVVELPQGQKEIIINTEKIPDKMEYYLNAYDDNLHLKANPKIKIVGWLFV